MGEADYERVPLDDWASVRTHLRDFAEGGAVTESDEGIAVTVGSARFSVTRDGRVEAGMPLHDFEDGGVEALYFDRAHDRIRVEGGEVSYEFRRPS
ncbi:hypothetical protein NGM10_07095 [Halorussus salilacus]|uniref:hypothetical protein n=1 Tax=Halorussus salilacus TaxID=2953750 RepID=UPI00209E42AA|nr:hypothetical protein [Halorussus salilacus]USZ69493.1 hypothetical protein NGM10_07095 [Halorussus salilacus]